MIFFYCVQGKPAKWRDFHSATAVGTNMYIFGGRGRSARNMCRFIKLTLFSFWCTVYSKTNESLENVNCYICVVFLGATKANNSSNTKSHFQHTLTHTLRLVTWPHYGRLVKVCSRCVQNYSELHTCMCIFQHG